ncbi:MAG: hypothetical protein ACKPB7_09870 [Sphaerospermopsis kisseleviana]
MKKQVSREQGKLFVFFPVPSPQFPVPSLNQKTNNLVNIRIFCSYHLQKSTHNP